MSANRFELNVSAAPGKKFTAAEEGTLRRVAAAFKQALAEEVEFADVEWAILLCDGAVVRHGEFQTRYDGHTVVGTPFVR